LRHLQKKTMISAVINRHGQRWF